MGEGFLVAGSYLQRVSLGDGEPATLPVGSWAASFWDENLLFHLTATTRIVLFLADLVFHPY